MNRSSGEWASPVALELLDEMVSVLDECGVIVAVLGDEAQLNLDELTTGLESARAVAVDAYKAASLLNVQALLAESWGSGRSRPRAIFARHSEAVRNGAPRMQPAMPSERFPTDVVDEPCEGLRVNHSAPKPQCSAIAKSTGKQCANLVLHVGGGDLTSHCFGHLSPEERSIYDQQRTSMAETERRRSNALAEQILDDGHATAADWMNRQNERRSRETLVK